MVVLNNHINGTELPSLFSVTGEGYFQKRESNYLSYNNKRHSLVLAWIGN